MSDPVILIEHLSKSYRLGQIGTGTLSYDLKIWWAKLWGKPNPMLRIGEKDHGNREGEVVWALKDVDLQVHQGEVVGIIGKNGAGKSTLLKILARVTAPTMGQVKVKGRIASLLEVGTGFHPDLTGRENIYLNGAILGMRKDEIKRKFDEVVDFAGISQFIDTPVKRYSSGMYVRLAFAVAAHLESEILLIDEVLAVGDAEFQKKCLGKMGDISANEGRTVLFVSHNMGSIRLLCTRCSYLQKGTITYNGDPQDVIGKYLYSLESSSKDELKKRIDRSGRGVIRLEKVEILPLPNMENEPGNIIYGAPAIFIFHLSKPAEMIECTFTIYSEIGDPIVVFKSSIKSKNDKKTHDRKRISCEIDEVLLTPGRYHINVALASNGFVEDHIEGAAFFTVETGLLHGRPVIHGIGNVGFPHHWNVPD